MTVIAFCLLLIAIPKTRRTIALPVSAAVALSALINIVLKTCLHGSGRTYCGLFRRPATAFPAATR